MSLPPSARPHNVLPVSSTITASFLRPATRCPHIQPLHTNCVRHRQMARCCAETPPCYVKRHLSGSVLVVEGTPQLNHEHSSTEGPICRGPAPQAGNPRNGPPQAARRSGAHQSAPRGGTVCPRPAQRGPRRAPRHRACNHSTPTPRAESVAQVMPHGSARVNCKPLHRARLSTGEQSKRGSTLTRSLSVPMSTALHGPPWVAEALARRSPSADAYRQGASPARVNA